MTFVGVGAGTSTFTAGSSIVYDMESATPATPGTTFTVTQNQTRQVTSDGTNFYVSASVPRGVLIASGTTGTGNVVLATSPSISGLTVTGSLTATGLVPLIALATQAADTVDMNATGGSASPTAVAMPTCTSGADLYNTSTHSWSCVSTAGAVSSVNTLTGAVVIEAATAGQLAISGGSGGALTGAADFTYATHTLSGGSSAILDMHAAPVTTGF